ncbi:MAG: hypothetical protein HPY53_05780 [Brevinematales bacterium]|nr:hypothetical protein [Brevinematales bacterium]
MKRWVFVLMAGLFASSCDLFNTALSDTSSKTKVWSMEVFHAPDGMSQDEFGKAVALSSNGTTLVVGAPSDDDMGWTSGSVYIFRKVWSGWTTKKLVASDGASSDMYGSSVAVSADGNILLVGAYGKSSSRGAVYLYMWNGTDWVETKLTAPGAAVGERFGFSVAISGDGNKLLAGAWGNNDGGTLVGAAYLFKWSGVAWNTNKITPYWGTIFGEFGLSVSMAADGNTFAVGAAMDTDLGTDAGAAYIYQWNGSDWDETKFVAYDGAAGDDFGWSVSLSADGLKLAAGAYGDESQKGAVYIFKWNGVSWQTNKISASDGAAGDKFGLSVSISGDGAAFIAGAPLDNVMASDDGSMYIYKLSYNEWTGEKFTERVGEDYNAYGTAVAVSGDGKVFAVGSYRDSDKGLESGTVYLYQ